MMTKHYKYLFMLMICGAIVACSKENEEALRAPTGGGGGIPACDTVNMKFAANVTPILSANCYSCHGNGRAFGGVNLDTYANVKLVVNSGSLLGTISHASGFSPMPKNAAKLSDCDINKIRGWINRGALNN
jgi:mono/diheme cytochrome c family protein